MNLNGLLFVLVGIMLLYLAISGKLNCIISAWSACKLRDLNLTGSTDTNDVQGASASAGFIPATEVFQKMVK